MYHIANDLRAKKSVEKLLSALERELESKKIEEISIKQLCESAGIGRSTFYRLFDNIIDPLAYQCDEIVNSIAKKMSSTSGLSLKSLTQEYITVWMHHKHLLNTLRLSNRLDILYQAHIANADAFHAVLKHRGSISPAQEAYAFAAFSVALPSYIRLWVLRGEKESAEELYEIIKANHVLTAKLM